MKRLRMLFVFTISLCIVALLAACGGSSTGSGNDNGTPSATTAATSPTTKPKSMPHFTVDSCNQLMSLDEMKSIFNPPAPATTIVPTNGDTGGACNYEASKKNIPLIIYFLAWNGPDPIPQSDIQAALSQAAGANLTINNATPVSGIADQAEYLDATGAGGATMHIFYVLEGPFIFDCFTYSPLSAGFLATQDQLQQCATQVDSRL
jgi:hypothetical protein